MERTTLGRSGIEVSAWCLGTMTFGNQTDEAEAHRQIDMAVEAGIDFLDAAEMYPVNPVKAETVGRTEEIVGNWMRASPRSGDVKIATKISGPNGGFVRGGKGYDGATIRETIEAQLRRLNVERIDVYQLHWPERGSFAFRQMWSYDPSAQDPATTRAHMDDVLGALSDLTTEGKIGAFGLSNESCWGTTKWIERSEVTGGPRVAAVQNEYNLLYRHWDTDLAEMSVNEDVPLFSYSPLAAGLLTGKYQNGAKPEGSRAAINGDLGGRLTEQALTAVQAYADLAQEHGLDLVQMSLAWQRQRPFPVIPILGATTAAQLQQQLAGADLVLSEAVLTGIDAINKAHPFPY
ncbi:aldo/keto reductase [Pseudoroseicyclus aestuarii]|uniref:Aryl-alcohol dehydrogenase-like predicted oxidoreductase n=1 Tax=Pseudoroseicyclus aestuarii TaxID=1795041 RepID=A0A318SVK1_9RHOB|nr:aldo/keto reductase [Pseudoroseicyclus aestuarii]PYE85880.1 aryl-alcohol dehydrogenase-like predicted oxidoreductase [Pseudoroseicyclus aestuarii]